jgi:hypothetical protein
MGWKDEADGGAARLQGMSQRIESQLPPDVLGIYVYLP